MFLLLKKTLKFVIIIIIVIFTFSGSIFISAFFAQFIINVQNVDITLGSLESSDTEFTVSFAPSSGVNNESYRITAFSNCNQNEYDDFGNCIDLVPNLCPYLSLQPKNEEITEIGFTQNLSDFQATGQLNNPDDEIDIWNLSIKSPCFEGECPTDYDEFQNGAPLPQILKNQTFKCVLSVETSDIPELVKNYLEKNIIYADDFINSLEVSAIFTGELPGCITDCFSNVLFLPGMMGSKLYEAGLDCDDVFVGNECGDKTIWVSIFDNLQKKLSLDALGKSINNLFTKNDTQYDGGNEMGIIDEIGVFNIYKSFISDLKKWKEEEKIIEDYAFIPYDWRLSLEDIISNGKVLEENLSYINSQNFEESFILKKLEELQKTSKSGKVTILAHSNGGLVTKALMQKLKDTNNPLYEKIDKIIFVAVPQVGTPEAFVSLLHGVKVGKGFVMNADMARNLAENMPTIYNLLPSENYFTNLQIPFTLDKLISFQDKEIFKKEISKYDLMIDNYSELKAYILGKEERDKPSFEDTRNPNIGNSFLYDQAQAVHQILDNWQPSSETKVIQIAGWGEETIASIEYKEYITRECKDGICGPSSKISYKIKKVIDGDGTVVVPSTLFMSPSENIERWWVDLKEINRGKLRKYNHKDILEIPNLRDFIKSKTKDEVLFIDSENIVLNNNLNLKSSKSRLHFQLHSPLYLGIIDNEGRYTGIDPITKEIKEEIPDVTYQQIGEVQFLSISYGLEYTLKLQGYTEGSFSLDIDKQEGNEITESASFQGIPSDSNTLATLAIDTNFKVGDSVLNIDNNGDKTTDITLIAILNGTTLYEESKELSSKSIIYSGNSQENPSASGAVNIFMIAQNNKTDNIVYEENIEQIKNQIEKKEEVSEINIVNNKIKKNNFKPKIEVAKNIEDNLKTPQKTEVESKNEVFPLQASVVEFNTNNSAKLPIIIVSLFLVGIIIFKFIKV